MAWIFTTWPTHEKGLITWPAEGGGGGSGDVVAISHQVHSHGPREGRVQGLDHMACTPARGFIRVLRAEQVKWWRYPTRATVPGRNVRRMTEFFTWPAQEEGFDHKACTGGV